MTPTQITKLIEHYGLPEGLLYTQNEEAALQWSVEHREEFPEYEFGRPEPVTDYLPQRFGLILLAHHIKEQREKTAYFFMQNEPVNEILTAALEIIE